MRLYVFDDYRLGVLGSDGNIADITEAVRAQTAPIDRMTELITRWAELSSTVARLARDRSGVRAADVVIRPPVPRPGKVIAAPVNYRLHQQEMGGEGGVYPGETIKTIETYCGFIKASSSVIGPDSAIVIPFEDRRVDHEGELGLVIGKAARNVSASEAHGYIFGYLPLLDITLRGEEDRSFRKSFDTFTPIGPAIVTADEVGDPGDLDLALTVNGEPRQRANTKDLIYGVGRLIELYSSAMTLEPGDVIATGTPEGVGPIEAGDTVHLAVERVGELTMSVTGATRR
jgi:2-keto-4-pentenoate hydratase/2-oxohepta-3-ene-1,7-dioic acid hydratase in catechol pathway